MLADNFGQAWSVEEREQGEMRGRGGGMTLREKKEIELEQSNFWGRHHGPAYMALSLSLCCGDLGVTDGRLTCNGSHFQRAV